MSGDTVHSCLEALDLKEDDLAECVNLEAEWALVKQHFARAALANHPDKGGSPEDFRNVRAAFEALRQLYEAEEVPSFTSSDVPSTAEAYRTSKDEFEKGPLPSYEFFAAAETTPMPIYRIEIAKSGRSQCANQGKFKKCGYGDDVFIKKGELRVGAIDGLGSALEGQAGTYGRWTHLRCWRVPNKIWLGLPDPDKEEEKPPSPVESSRGDDSSSILLERVESALHSMNEVLLSGFSDLPEKSRLEVAEHAADKSNWTRPVRRKHLPPGLVERKWVAPGADPGASNLDPTVVARGPAPRRSSRLTAHRPHFKPPTPTKETKDLLAGHAVVITGTFPELGGSSGLNLGKGKAEEIVTSFGGRVVHGPVSGRTTLLLVGQRPGKKSVEAARSRPNQVQLVTLSALARNLYRGKLKPPSDGEGPGVLTGPGVEGTRGLSLSVKEEGEESSKDAGTVSKRLNIPEYSPGFVTTRGTRPRSTKRITVPRGIKAPTKSRGKGKGQNKDKSKVKSDLRLEAPKGTAKGKRKAENLEGPVATAVKRRHHTTTEQ